MAGSGCIGFKAAGHIHVRAASAACRDSAILRGEVLRVDLARTASLGFELRGLTVEQLSAARDQSVPLGRGCSPEECAGLIRFLLSDESAYMTGQSINFTGGLVTW